MEEDRRLGRSAGVLHGGAGVEPAARSDGKGGRASRDVRAREQWSCEGEIGKRRVGKECRN